MMDMPALCWLATVFGLQRPPRRCPGATGGRRISRACALAAY